MEKNKIIIACGLGAIILILVGVMLYYKDTVFRNEITIEYPDGCVETYVNNKPISPMCIEGRKIMDDQLSKGANANSEVLWTGDEEWTKKLNLS